MNTGAHTVASLLVTLEQRGIADANQRKALADLTPTVPWIAALQALAAWVAALLVAGAAAGFGSLGAAGGRSVVAVLLIGAALWLFWPQPQPQPQPVSRPNGAGPVHRRAIVAA